MRVTKSHKCLYIRFFWLSSCSLEEFAIRAIHDEWRVACQSVLNITGASVRCGIVERHQTEVVLESFILEHLQIASVRTCSEVGFHDFQRFSSRQHLSAT